MLKTKYITEDDFLTEFGINLSSTLKDDDNPSNKVNVFLSKREEEIELFVFDNFYLDIEYEYRKLTELQKEHYKKALLNQAKYVLENGEISMDSGYDIESGRAVANTILKDKMISPLAIKHLRMCGLGTRKIKNKGRGFYDWWMR